jgi:hypothetical protein
MKVKDIIEKLLLYDGETEFFLEAKYQPYAGANEVIDIYRMTDIYGRGAPHAILEYCGEKPDGEE